MEISKLEMLINSRKMGVPGKSQLKMFLQQEKIKELEKRLDKDEKERG